MKIADRTTKTVLARSLLVGVLVFAMTFLFRRYVLPSLPALEDPFLGALTAGAAGAVAGWIVFRRWGS